MAVQFEWDVAKAAANLRKHRISFDEARTVFADHAAMIHFDDQHSIDEQREIIIGHSRLNRVLLVSFTERAEGVIRIISALRATKRERQDYEENA